ncbi:hypothetical protein PGB90_001998 [Kerria lacca]
MSVYIYKIYTCRGKERVAAGSAEATSHSAPGRSPQSTASGVHVICQCPQQRTRPGVVIATIVFGYSISSVCRARPTSTFASIPKKKKHVPIGAFSTFVRR